MNRIIPTLSAISLFLVIWLFSDTAAIAQVTGDAGSGQIAVTGNVITEHSELDFLSASQMPVSIDMKQVSARRILDTVAEAAGVRVAYQGQLDDKKFDVSYTKLPLKDLLTRLGTTLGVSYRVWGPTSLTVIGQRAP